MSLVTISEVRTLVKTSLDDQKLQEVIDRIEAMVTERIGAPQNDGGTVTVVETLAGDGDTLFAAAEISEVTSIVEDTVTLASSDYQTWPGGMIERLPSGSSWGARCIITYKPTDNRPKRKQAIIDLVRLTIERTAMQAESVAGEYSFTATGWEAEIQKIMRRLTFTAV